MIGKETPVQRAGGKSRVVAQQCLEVGGAASPVAENEDRIVRCMRGDGAVK